MYTNLLTRSSHLVAALMLAVIIVISPAISFGQKSVNRGSGGGPTPTPTPTLPNPLPQTAPAPDVIYRESFGFGPDNARPRGGNGVMRTLINGGSIQSYWIEYPGSSNTQWIAPSEVPTWRWCGASLNPHEMFSPLQNFGGDTGNGCVHSEWNLGTTQNPTALMPFTAPNVPYEVSFNGYPQSRDSYLAVGLTNSAVTYDNLKNSGSVVLLLKAAPPYLNYTVLYELRVGGVNGTLLASGETYFEGFNQMKLRYDPIARTVGANVNGTELGTFPLNIGTPRYAGFEGVGLGDNFVIRKLQ